MSPQEKLDRIREKLSAHPGPLAREIRSILDEPATPAKPLMQRVKERVKKAPAKKAPAKKKAASKKKVTRKKK